MTEPRHDKTNIVRLRPAWIQTYHAVGLQTLLQVEKLIANIMDPDQTRLVWTHAGRKRSMLVLSWLGSNVISKNRESKGKVWSSIIIFKVVFFFRDHGFKLHVI
jgi:hypothetical protein